jgi:hypothetical protein
MYIIPLIVFLAPVGSAVRNSVESIKLISTQTEAVEGWGETCWVVDELLSGGDCADYYQSQADASWEGLTSVQQAEITATGLHGIELDKLVIRVRDGILNEDEPGWDCSVHGNKICGVELPHTL